MGVGSIILGVAAILFTFGGMIASVVPVLGTLLSFGAPLLAIGGIVVGGLGMSRAKQEGSPTGAPMAGLIVSIVALIPALLVAVTCGLCNACFTAGMMGAPRDGQQQWWMSDGGPSPFGPPPPGPFGPAQPGLDPGAPGSPSFDPGSPPPAFPPPPMDPAPGEAAPSGQDPPKEEPPPEAPPAEI